MFIDHKKIFAAASASFCVRSVTASVFLCGGLLAGLAHADGGEGPQRRERDGQPAPQAQAPQHPNANGARQFDRPAGEAPRQADPRSYEARAEEQRRAMQDAAQNAEVSRRMGRMTPDERRDLRRQINEMGQDLYANPPRR